MAKYPFLSDEWMAEASEIRERSADADDAAGAQGQDEHGDHRGPRRRRHGRRINAHMDTSERRAEDGPGHLEGEDLTVTADYATAKAIFVDQNPQAGMQAFMAGKIKVQGDMTKLMAMQSGAPDPAAAEVAKQIKEITE